MVGCKEWFGSHVDEKADKWANKIKLVKKTFNGDLPYFEMENAPCWIYKWRSDADGVNAATKCMTTYSGGCWYGTCRHHARVYTAIFQGRINGQYNRVGEYYTKAMFISIPAHRWAEVYIKDEGYYICDVSMPRMLTPRHKPRGDGMGNRWVYGSLDYGCTPYQGQWAGPEIEPPPTPPEPKKTYINCVSSPTGASIWLKKH